MLTGGELVIRVLEQAGVEVVFGVLSVHNLPLYEAIARRGTLRMVAARGESGAVGMADGYARATGRLGVAITSTGVGAANAAGGLLEAYTASSSVLHLTGQVDSSSVAVDRGALHGAKDQLAMLASVGKAAYRVDRAADAATVTSHAIEQALSGRPGPVSVEIPIDQQYATVSDTDAPTPRLERHVASDEGLDAAVAALAGARRPLIWAGGGVVSSDAAPILQRLAERLNAGVITTQAGRGAVPETHPLCIGNFSVDETLVPLFEHADVMLAVGTRFRGNETRTWNLALPRPLVRIDADATVLQQNYAPDVALLGDARLTLAALDARLPERLNPAPEWRAAVVAARQAARARWRSMLGPHAAILDALSAALPANAIVVRDVTVPATVWGSRLLELREPRGALHSASMAIGQGLPMALGAAVGRPDRRVVLLVGDGGLPLAVGEMCVAIQEALNLLVVVFNDGGYGILRNLQDAHFDGARFGVDLTPPDFARLMESMGGWGTHIASVAELGPSLREAFGQTRAALIELDLAAIGPMAVPFIGAAPLVPSRAASPRG